MNRTVWLARAVGILILLFAGFSRGSSQMNWYWTDSYVIAPGYAPAVLKVNSPQLGSGYHCWYAIASSGNWDIYHTFSIDGMSWFSPWNAAGPALSHGSPDAFDAKWAVNPCVIVLDTQLVMYYNGYDGTKYQTGVAFSSDGVRWTKYSGNPVLRVQPGWESIATVPGKVIESPSGSAHRLSMYYIGYDGVSWRTGIAYSDDGLTWTRAGTSPVLDVGPPGTWDQHGASVNTIVADRGLYYMFYQTVMPSPIGIATSTDGVTWARYRRNPILQPPFEGISLGFGSMLLEDGILRYWFSLGGPSWGVSYAVSPWNPDFITGVGDAAGADGIALHEPYPNPFNPGTTMRYELPESKEVRLIVYDMVGREVSVLVNGRKDAGVHEVRFDGSGLASGVYITRLTAGTSVHTRKLLLLR